MTSRKAPRRIDKPLRTAMRSLVCCRDTATLARLVSMVLYPSLDVIEPETQMPAEPEMGDWVVVAARRAAVDERLGNTEERSDVLDRQVARGKEELKLFRCRRLILC